MRATFLCLLSLIAGAAQAAGAQSGYPHGPLGLQDVMRLASERRAEIEAARARARR